MSLRLELVVASRGRDFLIYRDDHFADPKMDILLSLCNSFVGSTRALSVMVALYNCRLAFL